MSTQTGTKASKIQFGNNGKLKIMHITDTHIDTDNIDISLWLIAKACDKENPDIVVMTGDNVLNFDDANITKAYITRIMSVFEERNIPIAVTFGNHDSEVGALTRDELMAYYNTFPCSVSAYLQGDFPDSGTYNVPVLSSDGSKTKYNLWIFDSMDYDDEGHYGCVLPGQIEWYKKKSDELASLNNGEKIYSLAFQHIIVDDVYEALKKVSKRKLYSFSHMYNKKDFYMFDPERTNFGTLNETPCSGYHNYGQFDAMVEKGDVLGIFSGHDHTNAFGVKYKGIDIVNSLSTRSNRDRFSSQYGYRIINVEEKDTSIYTSRVERWYNMFTFKDINAFKKSGDEYAYKAALNVTLSGMVQKFYTKTGRTFSKLVTGRRISYND